MHNFYACVYARISESTKGDVIVFYLRLLDVVYFVYNLFRRYSCSLLVLAGKLKEEGKKSLNENKGKIIDHEDDLFC